VLDVVAEGDDRRPGDLAERRAAVAEDAGVAVLVGGDPVAQPQVGQHAREDAQRVLLARVLRVGVDACERRLGLGALALELGHEDRLLARGALRV